MDQIAAAEAANPLPANALPKDGHAFCWAAWTNLSIAIDGSAKPCCEFKGDCGNVGQQSIEDIWHGETFRVFRAKIAKDERDSRCHKCYDMEATGGYSLRKQFNDEQESRAPGLSGIEALNDAFPDAQEPDLPAALDIRFSNLCNFSCRMCGHGASSKWFSDARKMDLAVAPGGLITTFSSTEAALDTLRPLLPTLKQIYFAGGEPLLIEQHYALLNELIKQGRTDVALRYNSNMSKLRLGRRDILALWSQFGDVLVEVSIDGSGSRGELIRQGLSWTEFAANVVTVKQQCPHVRILFGITVSVFNISSLPELHQDLMALNVTGEDDFHLHVLQEPEFYNVRVLPRRIKHAIRRHLEIYASAHPNARLGETDRSIQGQYRHIIDYMMAEDKAELIKQFRNVTLKLDSIRNTSTAAICPELAPLLHPPLSFRLRHLTRAVSNAAVRVKTWAAQVCA